MNYRRFGRVGWMVAEVGYGMWGMAGWTGSADEESLGVLDRSIELGCNFFDTAWAYGDGHSERLLGETLRRHPGKQLYIATKIPAEESQVAGPPRVSARRRLPCRLHPRVHREEPQEHRRRHPGPPAAARLERHLGGRRSLAARGVGVEGREAGPRRRHQRQPLPAAQRAEGARHRPDRRRAGRLQHARPEPRGSSCSPPARRGTSRSSPASHSTRAA